MSGRREFEELIASSRLAFTNGRDEADVQALLAPYGYDTAALDEALALVAQATAEYQNQQIEHAEQDTAAAERIARAAATRTMYLRHVKLARVAFEPASVGYTKLDLGGERERSLTAWMAQARAFYRLLGEDRELREALGALPVDTRAAEAALDQVEAAIDREVVETAEAKAATRARDDVMARLRGHKRDFLDVAEVALADHPHLLRKLGVVVRA